MNLYLFSSEERGFFVSLVVQWDKVENHIFVQMQNKHCGRSPPHGLRHHKSAANPLMGISYANRIEYALFHRGETMKNAMRSLY